MVRHLHRQLVMAGLILPVTNDGFIREDEREPPLPHSQGSCLIGPILTEETGT